MKTKTVVVDTNFIYTYLDKDDTNYNLAEDLLRDYSGYSFIIPTVVVSELIASGADVDFISYCKIFTHKFANISEEDLEYMQKMDKSIKRSLKAIDCLLLAMCNRYDAELLTFDHKLGNAYKNLFKLA